MKLKTRRHVEAQDLAALRAHLDAAHSALLRAACGDGLRGSALTCASQDALMRTAHSLQLATDGLGEVAQGHVIDLRGSR